MQLKTRAEQTNYQQTSRHKDVLAFIEALVEIHPYAYRASIGKSGEGQDIAAIVLSDQKAFTPAQARKQKKMVVMIEANIHAGEVEGKEASLALARDLCLESNQHKILFSKLCIVIIPNFNPDGNDRIHPSNRKLNLKELEGQVNPKGGVGTRYTGEGWNLNRDAIKQEAIETRNMAAFYKKWDPDVFIDCHTTDGSLHSYDLTYDTSHSNQPLFKNLLENTGLLLEQVGQRILKKYGYGSHWYGNFVHEHEPEMGWQTYPALPRFGSHYRGLLGKIDILLETYSYIDFKKRCQVMYAWLYELLYEFSKQKEISQRLIAEQKKEILDRGTFYNPCSKVGINYGVARRNEQDKLLFDYPAYQKEGEETEIQSFDRQSLEKRLYPGKKKQKYLIPHLRTFVPVYSVATPMAYLVPSFLEEKLQNHGIEFEVWQSKVPMDVEAYRILSIEKTFSPDVASAVSSKTQSEIPLSLKPTPVRFETVLSVFAEKKKIKISKKMLLVKTAQPRGTLVVYLLEPHSDDGFARWEFLDGHIKIGDDFPIYRLLELETNRRNETKGKNKVRKYKPE